MTDKITNAFTLNLLAERPFPFSAIFFQEDKSHRLSIFPVSIDSISDIIEYFSSDFCVIFDVDHYGWFRKDKEINTLAEVAKGQGMEFKSYDDEIIICQKSEFGKLSKNYFSHYNWETFDCLSEPESDLVLQNYVICKDHKWNEELFLLNKLNDSGFYLKSHDNCYLLVEAYNREFLNQILQRNLQIFVETILIQNDFKPDVSEFPAELVEQILSNKQEITIFQENVGLRNEALEIPFSNASYHFTEKKDYIVSGNIFFDFVKNKWGVEK